jgi:predicted acyl esterase
MANTGVRRVLGVAGRALLAGAAAAAVLPGAASAAIVSQPVTFRAGDGVELHAYVGGEGDLRPRPLIVEFSPYAPACCGPSFGPEYNYVQVHARGTGRSSGVWGAVGPRDQLDVSEFLAWACRQPWSNGHIGLYGFSASAIAVYNSMHLPLACVDAASLMAGTADLYRDLLYPGGIMNFAPGAAVGFGVGVPLTASAFEETAEGGSPLDGLASGAGFIGLMVDVLTHTTQDAYWDARTQRPGPNTFPVLADTGFYDPEARGPFESFRLLRSRGSHLLILGAHDGHPAGTDGPFPHYQRWFDHFVRGVDNGIDREPAVQLWLGNGSREALAAGRFTRVDASRWPVPRTRWKRLFLDATKAGGATSLNDGSLRATDAPPATSARQSYPAISSLPTATDPHTTSTVGAAGADPFFAAVPALTRMDTVEPTALTYTTRPFTKDLDVAGPASLDVFLASTAPETDIHAVIADVWPDGRSFPVGGGRLRTSFPDIDRARSVIDRRGEIVQPYNLFRERKPATPGATREYHVEFWPLGNRFAAGHRLRLYLVGTSGYQLPALPGVNTVALGGATPSRLLVPVLPARRSGR